MSAEKCRLSDSQQLGTESRELLEPRCDLSVLGSFLDRELLEVILAEAGPAVAPLIACRLMKRFGSFGRVLSAPEQWLLKVEGVDRSIVRALKVVEASAHRLARSRAMGRPVISNWRAVVEYCRTILAHIDVENLRVLFLDRKNVLVHDECMAVGTVDHLVMYPREILKRALEQNASSIILVHNHPSGDPFPSEKDIVETWSIQESARVLRIKLHDHLIVGTHGVFSFRERGYLGHEESEPLADLLSLGSCSDLVLF